MKEINLTPGSRKFGWGIFCAVAFVGCAGDTGTRGPTGAEGPAGPVVATAIDRVDLQSATFFPESVAAAKDGTLFIGSLGGQGIVKVPVTSRVAESFVLAGSVKNIAGLLVDDAAGLLYACETDLAAKPFTTGLLSFDLATAQPRHTYAMPEAGVCNDLTFDGSGNLFVTDSFGKIYELRQGAQALELWSDDPLLAPSQASGFGADGIAFDGKSNLFVNAVSDNRLLRIAIDKDGKAGAVTEIAVTPALDLPDGMRLIDDHTLLVVEGAGRLTQVAIDGDAGTATTLVNHLDGPSSVVTVADQHWITEGQVGIFFGLVQGPPSLPFSARRFQAEAPIAK